MRYVNLSTVLVYRLVSEKVMDRFPDYESLIKAKLMLPNEVKRLEKTDEKTPHESTWTPILWAMKLLVRARLEGKIQVDLFTSYNISYISPFFNHVHNSGRTLDSGAVEGLKIKGGDWSGNIENGKKFPHFHYVIFRKLGGDRPPPPCSTAPV